jgi:hypothetical protein
MKQILIEEVKQHLRKLKMNDMADTLDQTLMNAGKKREGHLTFLANLVKKQVDAKNDRSIERVQIL